MARLSPRQDYHGKSAGWEDKPRLRDPAGACYRCQINQLCRAHPVFPQSGNLTLTLTRGCAGLACRSGRAAGMKFIPLIWKGLWRSRARTILTLLSAMVAFVLFGVLQGADTYISQMVGRLHLDVLAATNPAFLPMPVAYLRQIAAVPGVTGVTPGVQSDGYFRDPRNDFGVSALEPVSAFEVDGGDLIA